MAMDLREHFRMHCSQMLLAEQDILQMTQVMIGECGTPELRESLQRHTDPTQQQIDNLQRIVQDLGGPVGPSRNLVTQAMMQAHQQFMGMSPSQNMIDIHDMFEGLKVEHFEIASYKGLIAMAEALGETRMAEMLQQNLRGEQAMAEQIERTMPTMVRQLGGQGGRMAA